MSSSHKLGESLELDMGPSYLPKPIKFEMTLVSKAPRAHAKIKGTTIKTGGSLFYWPVIITT